MIYKYLFPFYLIIKNHDSLNNTLCHITKRYYNHIRIGKEVIKKTILVRTVNIETVAIPNVSVTSKVKSGQIKGNQNRHTIG